MSDAHSILIAGSLMAAALAASLLAGRLQVPSLLLFLGLGMVVGSDALGWIHFDDYELARTIGVIALALILFEGGLSTPMGELRPVLPTAASLASVGTAVTAVITGLVAKVLFDLSLLEALLLGSIVSSTDGAAIFAVLRNSRLRPRVARTLESESGLNDPIAVLLVVGLIDWIQEPGYGLVDFTWLFAKELGIGLVIGIAVGVLGLQALRRLRLGGEAAYPIATLTTAALAYGGAASLDGSGFLAVYVAGLILASNPFPAQHAATVFHQGVAGLAQVSMFLVLGLLVFPSQLWDVAAEGTVLALVLTFAARPIATFIATAGSQFDVREKIVLGWAGLRGAVPVVLATFPVIADVPDSLRYFNIVFFAVLFSTVLQGTTFERLSEGLGITQRAGPRDLPPRRVGMGSAQVATVGPWEPEDGNPAYPRQVRGVRVKRQITTRLDGPGALIELEDGRYAFTGEIAAVGSARAVQQLARRRLSRAESDEEVAWWRDVIGSLARGGD